MEEIWKQIKDFSHYEISNLGRVKSNHYNKPFIMKLGIDKDGYSKIQLRNKGKTKHFRVHILVALHFIGAKPSPEHMVAHEDGTKNNNIASNLSWKTNTENQQDRRKHGTAPIGSSNPRAKITEADVLIIRKRCKAGTTQADLCREYGLYKATMSHLILGKSWKHVPVT